MNGTDDNKSSLTIGARVFKEAKSDLFSGLSWFTLAYFVLNGIVGKDAIFYYSELAYPVFLVFAWATFFVVAFILAPSFNVIISSIISSITGTRFVDVPPSKEKLIESCVKAPLTTITFVLISWYALEFGESELNKRITQGNFCYALQNALPEQNIKANLKVNEFCRKLG